MSISSALLAAQGRVADSYTAVSNKGGTLPATQNLTNLATAISSIPSGSTSEKYGATVDTFLGNINNGILQKPSGGQKVLVFTGVTNLAQEALYYCFAYNQAIKSASFPDLTSITTAYALAYCFHDSSIQSAYFPELISINGTYSAQYAFSDSILQTISLPKLTLLSQCPHMFSDSSLSGEFVLPSLTTLTDNNGYLCDNCVDITSVSLPELATAGNCQYMFHNDYKITSFSMPKLTEISNFQYGLSVSSTNKNKTVLTSVSFPSLSLLKSSYSFRYAFQYRLALTDIYFPALTSSSFGSATNHFNSMLRYVVGCTVHFPSNLQSVIGSWSDVTSGFGGTSTTVLFDLPATS